MLRHVSVNARDPRALGALWAQALHGRLEVDDGPAAEVVAGTTALLFLQGESPLAHLDVRPDVPRDQEVARLQGPGASVVTDRRAPDGTGRVPPVHTGERPMPLVGTADARTMLPVVLDGYREGVLLETEGLAQEDGPGRSETTVAGLVKHLALVEDFWVTERRARQPSPAPWAAVDGDSDPGGERRTARDEPLADAVALHLVEETARHLGHLDVLRELLDGTTGE